jgi:hypothetical protein
LPRRVRGLILGESVCLAVQSCRLSAQWFGLRKSIDEPFNNARRH